jgi:hypothetical protein
MSRGARAHPIASAAARNSDPRPSCLLMSNNQRSTASLFMIGRVTSVLSASMVRRREQVYAKPRAHKQAPVCPAGSE